MAARLTLILLLFGLLGDTGAEKGREGNTYFEQGKYAAAATAYRKGAAALRDTTGAPYTGLQNNLGLALYRQDQYGAARRALARAQRTASTDAQRVRAAFNIATVAAAMGDRRVALRNYKRALLLDPTHEAARYNYEFLKRKMGTGASDDAPEVDPSPYAQRLKQKADALVARTQYTTAAALMKDGLRRDSTVSAYQDFITRIEQVARISRSEP
ncbi:MAG: hypothetical protein ABEL04_04790 [Salinibacter sp.]|uniref:hypothetical protein n=1 Tax=Salinibacter sp. TaxID=2065818 RepID=UPI0035D4D905